MITMGSSGAGRLLMPRQILSTVSALRELFRYARSGQDAEDPAVRVARIRGCRNSPELAIFTCVLVRCLPRLKRPEELA
jgi:hypothetical protein